ncbi:MAG: hydrolase [Candidatus Saccharibacteria bacterium]|nr:hydrolase [Candidatus Saccharibacteria bacterium]
MQDDKVLFGIRNIEPHKGKLNLPGGFLDYDETAEQAAIREVKEELGIDIKLTSFLGTYTDDYEGRPTINIMFIAQYTGGTIVPSDDLNGGEIVWRDIQDLPTRDEIGWNWYIAAQEDLLKWWQKSNSAS